jgi:hypothetical protein
MSRSLLVLHVRICGALSSAANPCVASEASHRNHNKPTITRALDDDVVLDLVDDTRLSYLPV